MSPLFAVCAKDLRLLSRDRGALFWAGLFPILFGVLFAAVFPSERNVTELVVALHADRRVPVDVQGTGVRFVPAATRDEASDLVRHGKVSAALDVSSDGLELLTDPARPAENGVVEAAIWRALALRAGAPELRRRSVPSETTRATGGFAVALPAAILWGLIGCAGAFATASISERRAGTYLRLCSSPMSTTTILGGKVLACFVASVLDSAILLVVARVAFDLHLDRWGALAIVVASCAACFAGITVLLGCLGRSEQSVGGAGWAVLLLFAMLGGAMIPLSVMPGWLRLVADVSPVKWGISALEGVTTRDLSLVEIVPACIVLVTVGATSLAAAASLSRRSAIA